MGASPVIATTQPQSDLSQLGQRLRRNSDFLNQLQGNEYFRALPMTLFDSSLSMDELSIVIEYSLQNVPSKKDIVQSIQEYAKKAEATADSLSEL